MVPGSLDLSGRIGGLFTSSCSLILVRRMRACLVVIIFVLAGSLAFGAEPDVFHIAVYGEAELDKPEGEKLEGLIVDELRREKDIVIDKESPYLIVSCGVMAHPHGARLVASVAFMTAESRILSHVPLTAETLQSLAHQVVAEFKKRELDGRRQERTDQLHERSNQSPQPTAGHSDN